jgi:RNA polymerase sigma-70 factor, ECF subfamily
MEELMADVASGSRSAFAQVYDLTSARTFGLILRVVVNRALSEEVLQDVYLFVWENASKFTASRGSLQAWINTIAHRRAVDCVRASQASTDRDWRVGSRSIDSEGDVVSESVELHFERSHLREAMLRLSSAQRLCLDLAYGAGMSQSEIAAHTGQPLGTVKSRMRDALTALRENLKYHSSAEAA